MSTKANKEKEVKQTKGEVSETPEVNLPKEDTTHPVEGSTTELDTLGPIESTKPEKKTGKSAEKAQTGAKLGKDEDKKVEDPVMDFKPDPEATYEFRSESTGFRYMIPNKALVWDEVNEVPKEIVLTDTEESPYAEDHSEFVKPSRKQLALVNGKLLVKGTDIPTLRYLLAFDGYAGKKKILPSNRKVKGLYSLIDPKEVDRLKVEQEKKKVQASNTILGAKPEKVEDFVLSRGKKIFGDAAVIEALKIAKIAPDLVLSSFDNPLVPIKADLIRAEYKGLLSVDKEKILDPKGKVLFVASGRDTLEDASKEILADTAKGKALSEIIAQK